MNIRPFNKCIWVSSDDFIYDKIKGMTSFFKENLVEDL
jgi:hypothetical protein